MSAVLQDGVYKFFGFGVHPQVVDGEPGAAEHHDAQVLAYVVQVSLDRAHDHGTQGLNSRGGKDGVDVDHAGLHGPGGYQNFRHEYDVIPELDPHHRHAGNKAVVQDGLRGIALAKGLLSEPVNLNVLAGYQVIGDLLHQGVRFVEQSPDMSKLGRVGHVAQLLLQAIVHYGHVAFSIQGFNRLS